MNINRDKIHASLAHTTVIDQEAMPAPEKNKAILKARARALAREPAAHEPASELIEVLQFRLADENYAIELSFIQEIYPLKALTPLPGTPPFVLGIVNVRGQVYSVVDIKKFFELPDQGLGDLNKVIIVHHNGIEFGILADVVTGVNSILLKDIQPSLPTLTGIRQEYLKGITRGQLIILDAERLLSDKTLIINGPG
jgi:purine-binding chemotaxis protein CheW